jgi:N-acetylglucosamine-6-phosphate deacetylase
MSNKTDVSGFIDLQVNGYRGVNFSSPKLTEKSFAIACNQLFKNGTAAFLPTMITCTENVYEQNLKIIGEVIKSPEFNNKILGIHAEGPFLSSKPGAIGAHNPQWVKKPDIKFLEKMQKWAGGNIRLLTIAAEIKDADKFAIHATELGITVSLGHQMAKANDLSRLSKAGAKALTHLGNAMPHLADRHDNSLLAGLAMRDLTAMIITDGHHLPAHLIETIIHSKGDDKVVVTSDASPLSGLEPGDYQSMGNKVVFEESGRLYNPEKKCLVGSSATMLECMNYLASLKILTLPRLLKVSFYNPLKLINIDPKSISSNKTIVFKEDVFIT